MILNGTEKSALLLMSIGADQAGEVLKHLTPFEVQKLITSMVNIQKISLKKLNEILHDFHDMVIENNTFSVNFDDKYLSDMLSKALGETTANSFLQETLELRNAKISIESLNCMEPKQLAFLLNNEHPQIVTTILIYLDKNQSAQVLTFLDNKKRAEIILRITEFNGIEESCLIELNKVINNLIKHKKLILSEKGGIKTAVSILNSMKIQDEKDILKNINLFDKHLADTLLQEMFSFENIIDLDDKYIKIVIQNIEKEKLYVALRNTKSIVKEKFFKNMSNVESSQLSLSLEKKSYISDISIKNEQKLLLIMLKSIINNGNISLKNLREYYV